jgi:hypothetical protein
MNKFPEIDARYDEVLRSQNVPQELWSEHQKWVRFYLHFCENDQVERRKITSKQSRGSSNRRSNDLLACGYCNSYKGKYAMRFIQSSGSDISHILSKLSIALLIGVLCNTIISPELV